MKRSKHSLSNYQLTTCEMGVLVPVGWWEALPGDTFRGSTSALIRVSPLVAPVMHPVTIRFHHFFVPNRLVWGTQHGDSGSFESFITGGADGNDAQVVPTIASTTQAGDLLDHLGVPNIGGINVNALPVRAYNMIYNEYYRDQDLTAPANIESTSLQKIAWEKDYFTSARPWPQKGSDITIPLGEKAPVQGFGKFNTTFGEANEAVHETGGIDRVYASAQKIESANNELFRIEEDPDNPGYPGIYADLSQAEAVNINEWRKAFALQRYQEARLRYGSRYTEYLRYLGINPADSRLQRPEYLGGGKQTLNFSEVLQTQRTDVGESPLGSMAGHGIAGMRTNRYHRFIEEHGIILTLMSVRPKTIYSQGIPRKFMRQDKEDYFQKELAQIGQQEIYNDEVYAVNGDRSVFGYQDRYQEYKQEWSGISGEFRNLLNYWHFGREFTGAPALNGTFIQCDPTKRVYAEQTQNPLWCMINHSVQARRLVPKSAASRVL